MYKFIQHVVSKRCDFILFFFIIKIAILIIVFFSRSLLPINYASALANFAYRESSLSFLQGFSNWDGQWYAYLAEKGYHSILPGTLNDMKYVFYPLFPVLIRITTHLIPEIFLATYLLNTLLELCAVLIFIELLDLDKNSKIADFFAARLLIVAPMAIFLNAMYSESLFLLLMLSVVFLARKHHFMCANIAAGISVFSRAQGIILLIPILLEMFEYLRIKKFTIKNIGYKKIIINSLFLLIIPACLFVYSVYIRSLTGSQTAPLTSMLIFGRLPHHLINIPLLFYVNVKYFLTMPLHAYHTSQLDFITVILILILQLATFRKMRLSYTMLNLGLLVMPLLSGKTTSILRYMAVSFPIYIMVAKMVEKNLLAKEVVLVGSAILMTLFTILFVNWHWVA